MGKCMFAGCTAPASCIQNMDDMGAYFWCPGHLPDLNGMQRELANTGVHGMQRTARLLAQVDALRGVKEGG